MRSASQASSSGLPQRKPDILAEAKMRDRVCGAIADVLPNPTHRENPAAGKLNGVYDLVAPL
jgi:hypothetical protein